LSCWRARWLLATLAILVGSTCAHKRDAAHPLEIERLGGLAGLGTPGSRLRSHGEVDMSTLSASDRQVVESLFASPPTTPLRPDEFRYRLTRWTDKGPESVEVPESQVPGAVTSAVRDDLR
jgi:hypothetical protein